MSDDASLNSDFGLARSFDIACHRRLRYPSPRSGLSELHVIVYSPTRSRVTFFIALALAALCFERTAAAEPFIAPGRTELRVDLQTLADAGIISGPVTAWPISWQAVINGLDEVDLSALSQYERRAYDRVRTEASVNDQIFRILPHVRFGGASDPVTVRSFTDTPREEGEFEGGISYTGNRLSFNIDVTRAVNSNDDWRLDGSYVGFAIRKWAVVAGYPERWWGPGIQGSLILSTNARPVPQIGVERISADGFETRWLRWIGPWTVSTFIGELDDDRYVPNAKLFGLRLTARPLPQLEIGLSRAAQLCGDGRSCGASEFFNMLLGRDNRGVNVSDEAEPGNQLAGIDGRWSFAHGRSAIYWQWIGEDSRQGGPQIGNWLRMLGAERAGMLAGSRWSHRTYVELADTTCQQGGGGFGGDLYNCAYQHGIYRSGFRYQGRPLAYPTDGDSESVAVVSVLSSPGNGSWELAASSARINQGPVSNQPHGLSATPASRYGISVTHIRDLPLGRLRLQLSVARQNDQLTGASDNDSAIAVEWLVGYW